MRSDPIRIGDGFRLPSGRHVSVIDMNDDAYLCEYLDTGETVSLTARFLVEHGWRLV